MENRKTDRRVRYTKMVIRDALVELMETQHISQISIKSLCELADVNRSTFYAHYTDQYDLLRQVEQEVLENLKHYLEKWSPQGPYFVSEAVLTSILDYVRENAALFKALLSDNCDAAIQKDVVVLTQVVPTEYNATVDERTKEYLYAFGIDGCISLLHKWLKDGMIESTQQMSALLLRALYQGMSGFQ